VYGLAAIISGAFRFIAGSFRFFIVVRWLAVEHSLRYSQEPQEIKADVIPFEKVA